MDKIFKNNNERNTNTQNINGKENIISNENKIIKKINFDYTKKIIFN